MSTLIGKINQTVTRLVHSHEVRHDAALFAGFLTTTAVVGDLRSGVPLTWAALASALTVAARRLVLARLAGK